MVLSDAAWVFIILILVVGIPFIIIVAWNEYTLMYDGILICDKCYKHVPVKGGRIYIGICDECKKKMEVMNGCME